jgi:hypothetical protein
MPDTAKLGLAAFKGAKSPLAMICIFGHVTLLLNAGDGESAAPKHYHDHGGMRDVAEGGTSSAGDGIHATWILVRDAPQQDGFT